MLAGASSTGQPRLRGPARQAIEATTIRILHLTNDDEARARVKRIFAFLHDLADQRSPVIRDLGRHEWLLRLRDLPAHPTIERVNPVSADASDMVPGGNPSADHEAGLLLRVRRPRLTACPQPPTALREWLDEGWQNPSAEVRPRPTRNERDVRGETQIIRFEDDPARHVALRSWLAQRDAWAVNERPARSAMDIFERLFGLWGTIEREGERVELVVGDGILRWAAGEQPIDHPLLLLRVALEFEPGVPEFRIVEGDKAPEFYGSALQSAPGVSGEILHDCQRQVDEGGYHPLGDGDTAGFLRSVVGRLSAHGSYHSGPLTAAAGEHPAIGRDPAILLRKRTLGFPLALVHVLEDLEAGGQVPPSLVRIAGFEPAVAREHEPDTNESAFPEETEDVLFTKPANPEQVRIARQLDRHRAVLVQGPPGTGKSHTIANLIGHLMARGQRVLVTSHATKALRVLRGHVVDGLRALCVSLLDNDLEGRRQLEQAVEAIVQGLTTRNKEQLRREAEELAEQRGELLERIRVCRSELQLCHEHEYAPITISGETTEPSAAAREVLAGESEHAWIPGPLERGAPIPVSGDELRELYATSAQVEERDERELTERLPAVSELPSGQQFARAVAAASEPDVLFGAEYWSSSPTAGNAKAVSQLIERVLATHRYLSTGESWRPAVLNAALAGEAGVQPWRRLLQDVESTVQLGRECRELEIEYEQSLQAGDPEPILQVLRQMRRHCEAGGSLGWLNLLTRPTWKHLLASSRVNGTAPSRAQHFVVLEATAQLRLARLKLGKRWNALLASSGGTTFQDLPDPAEETCAQYLAELRRLIGWWATEWAQFEGELTETDFRWRPFLDAQPPVPERHGPVLRIERCLAPGLQNVLEARHRAILKVEAEEALRALREFLDAYGGETVGQLALAVTDRDVQGFGHALEVLGVLDAKRATFERRNALLKKLGTAAPAWAEAIRRRDELHGCAALPGPPAKSWRWRQLHQELEHRAILDERVLSKQLEHLRAQFRRLTAEMVDRFTWVAQHERTTLEQQQALVGWVQAVRKVGKGTGKGAPRLLAEARKKMAKARTAVPVWIMPLSRVAESFDPRDGKFDVVIIDEASQSDVLGLLAFYLGHRVVVVGDHEQVSPSAVGQDLEKVHGLIEQHLADVPNRDLYDGRTSIYDLAQQSFGGTITLTEHFRCVPSIIEFSNRLSYSGKIRPLREIAGALSPHLLEYAVQDGSYDGRVNVPEARMVAALLGAALEDPEYAGRSMGVVSLLGQDQAIEIQKLVSHRLPPAELERRRVLCGNAAQFQGDERDVMFLSMVHSPRGGPLSLLDRAEFKQRYNVAASRARDQMWLVHSLNPDTDLKPGDLRKRLVDHVRDPFALAKAVASTTATAESPFEIEVIAYLVEAGYTVKSQVSVGYYWIDLVVFGNDKRIAVECDGDRFHPLEKIPEDMARQAVLERLGWTFIRIRGSRYFRAPQKTMEWLCDELGKHGISPGSSASPAGTEMGSDLRDRLTRRAHELLNEWYPAPQESSGAGA
jgi:very-short-patch-repair endonuclease